MTFANKMRDVHCEATVSPSITNYIAHLAVGSLGGKTCIASLLDIESRLCVEGF